MCSLKGQTIDSTSRCAFSPATGMERKNKLLGSETTSSLKGSYFSYLLPPKVMVRISTTIFFFLTGEERGPIVSLIIKMMLFLRTFLVTQHNGHLRHYPGSDMILIRRPIGCPGHTHKYEIRLVPSYFMTSGQPPTAPREHELRIQVQGWCLTDGCSSLFLSLCCFLFLDL